MMNLLSKGLIICVLIVPSLEQLTFTFRTQYDGYIYPKWKKKDKVMNKYFYEDAVVVGKDFIVLGDGLGGAPGLSGVFAIHQCLNIARRLATCTPKTVGDVTKEVVDASTHAAYALGLRGSSIRMTDVATTLVYVKLHKNKLYSGVIGDSGFILFRFDSKSEIMKLEERSKERVHSFNTPYSVSPDQIDNPGEYTHTVKEGDVMMVLSDGVGDVLPSSFITAVANLLIGIMLEKMENNIPFEEYDYDYDLADFVEGYVQNLVELSIQLQKQIVKKPPQVKAAQQQVVNQPPSNPNGKTSSTQQQSKQQINQPNQPLQSSQVSGLQSQVKNFSFEDFETNVANEEEDVALDIPIFDKIKKKFVKDQNSSTIIEQFNTQIKIMKPASKKFQLMDVSDGEINVEDSEEEDLNQKLATKNINHMKIPSQGNLKQQPNQRPPISPEQEQLEKEIDAAMEKIYRYEICNIFDPSEDSSIFKRFPEVSGFNDLTRHNLQHKNSNPSKPIDCFRNKNVVKNTHHDRLPSKWKCKDILHLTFPIHPTKDLLGSFHNFHKCVLDVIPKLPPGTTPAKIAKSFNSPYFSRNIILAVKYVVNDPRVKVDDYLLKFYFNQNANRVIFPYRKIPYEESVWSAKNDDASIAAAAITSKDIFEKLSPKVDPKTVFKKDLLAHSYNIESWFELQLKQNSSHNFI